VDNLIEIIPILDQEVQKYVNQFGCPELRRNLGQPFFTCELNKIPTLIYPRPIVDGEIYENSHFEEIKEQVRKTHRIIRLDIEIENNVAVLVKAIIVSDLVSNQYMK
jgi:hypothetical protein